jgi:hypothetical protein
LDTSVICVPIEMPVKADWLILTALIVVRMLELAVLVNLALELVLERVEDSGFVELWVLVFKVELGNFVVVTTIGEGRIPEMLHLE